MNETLKGIGRSLITLAGIVLGILSVLPKIGWVLGVVGIALLSWGILLSKDDTSHFKYANIAIKVVFILLVLAFIIKGLQA